MYVHNAITLKLRLDVTRYLARWLMVGAELVLDEQRTPARDLRNRVERAAIDHGHLILGCGENTLRFCPPLMVAREDVQAGRERFGQRQCQWGELLTEYLSLTADFIVADIVLPVRSVSRTHCPPTRRTQSQAARRQCPL
jgi:hypothetical protein